MSNEPKHPESGVSTHGYYEYECSEPTCRKTWLYPSWQGKHSLFSGGTGIRCIICGAGLSFVQRIGERKDVQPKVTIEEALVQREILGLLREIRDSLQDIRRDVRETRKQSERPVNIVATIDSSKQFE